MFNGAGCMRCLLILAVLLPSVAGAAVMCLMCGVGVAVLVVRCSC